MTLGLPPQFFTVDGVARAALFVYKEDTKLNRDEVLKLYSDVGWIAYTNDPDTLMAGIEASLDFITAWENNKLSDNLSSFTSNNDYFQSYKMKIEISETGSRTRACF